MTQLLWISFGMLALLYAVLYILAEKLNRNLSNYATLAKQAVDAMQLCDAMLQDAITELAEHDRSKAIELARQRDLILEIIVD